MTVNRVRTASSKRELLPVLWEQLNAIYSTSWRRFVQCDRKQKLIIFSHIWAIDRLKNCNKLQLHDAIYRLRSYSNSLIHISSFSNSHNNVASIQKNRGDKSHRVIVAIGFSVRLNLQAGKTEILFKLY